MAGGCLQRPSCTIGLSSPKLKGCKGMTTAIMTLTFDLKSLGLNKKTLPHQLPKVTGERAEAS